MQLTSQGWHILRFTERDIEQHPQELLSVIYQALRVLTGGGSDTNESGEMTI